MFDSSVKSINILSTPGAIPACGCALNEIESYNITVLDRKMAF